LALPVTFAVPSTRGTDWPTMEKLRLSVLTEYSFPTRRFPRLEIGEMKRLRSKDTLAYNGPAHAVKADAHCL